MKSLLTIPIQESDPRNVINILRKNLPKVDVFEIWLDHLARKFQRPEIIEELCKDWRAVSKKKLLIVCKDKHEKGKFSGYTRHKVDLLIAAANAAVDYIDIGLISGKAQIHRLKKSLKRTKLIISWHDFLRTPSFRRLEKISQRMIDLEADTVKIACQVESIMDNENLMRLALDLKKKHRAHVIIGMGTLGVTTRVFSNHLGNDLTFVSLDTVTAPGQLTLKEMLQFQKVLPK